MHITPQLVLTVNNIHCTATQHIGWAHHQWITKLLGQANSLFHAGRSPVRGLLQTDAIDHLLEPFPVFRHIDGIRRGANNRNISSFKVPRQF